MSWGCVAFTFFFFEGLIIFLLMCIFFCFISLHILYLPGKRKGRVVWKEMGEDEGGGGYCMVARRAKLPLGRSWRWGLQGRGWFWQLGQRSGHSLRHLFAHCCWSYWLDGETGTGTGTGTGVLESWSVQPQPASYPGQTTTTPHHSY